MSILILYVFHQENANFANFVKRGLINSLDRQFVFIFNGENPPIEKWSFLHKYDNIHLFIRPNVGHDFQGWNDALFLPADALQNKIIRASELQYVTDGNFLHSRFDKIIFVNSTVWGPYIPQYCPTDWTECFTSKLSESVPISGMSVNFMGVTSHPRDIQTIKNYYGVAHTDLAHVQSMAFALHRTGLDILCKYGLFAYRRQFPKNKWELICSCEIGMSSLLRYHGHSMFSFLIGQGVIPASRTDPTDNFWSNPAFRVPLYESIFVKAMSHLTFPEQSRYESQL